MGDPAGIGGELTLRAWLALRGNGHSFVALDDPQRLVSLARALDLDVPIEVVQGPSEAGGVFAGALPVMPVPLAVRPLPGRPDDANAPAIVASIERAAALSLSGATGGVVTNPINKAALYRAGFAFPGHTEFLASLTNAVNRQVMMLVSPDLRVVPVTVHASLRNSIAMLTTEMILAASRTTAAALRDEFGIAYPRSEPACRRAGRAGRRGSGDHRARDCNAASRGYRCNRSLAAGHDVLAARPDALRCGDLHVPRPGVDPVEDARYGSWR
jgi:4-hydroxythreonine-4-phosphate dehydrogenase